MRRRLLRLLLVSAVAAAAVPGAAHAGGCAEPGLTWQAVAPGSQGLDATKLARAIHSYQDRRAYAVRIYRNGCLVGRDSGAGNDTLRFDSWEMTSSVLSLVAGREMQLGLLSPDDLVGALVPEADAAHGAITVRELLERTSGIVPGPDDMFLGHRLAWALAGDVVRRPGTTFGDAPVARALLAATLQRAAGEDLEAFTARELFAPLGVRSWTWQRDDDGLVESTFGLSLTADDVARLAELLRRGGVWRGRRLLSAGYVAQALTPTATNPCLGWLVWLNAQPGCDGSGQRLLPGIPADLWEWRGRYDQRVTVLPSLGLLIVRYGTTASDERSGEDPLVWERGILQQLLAAVRDARPAWTQGADDPPPATGEVFQDDARNVNAAAPAIPLPGPPRARVPDVTLLRDAAGRRRLLGVVVACPRIALLPCAGTASLAGVAAAPRHWAAVPGGHAEVLFRLRRGALTAPVPVNVTLVADDAAGGVAASLAFTARP